MEITVNTVKFQDMLNKVLKGAGMDPVRALTQNIGVKVEEDGNLYLMSTDSVSYLKVISKDAIINHSDDLFDLLIPIAKFSDVIKKITSSNITLKLEGTGCKVVGNGSYMIDLVEVDGEFPSFPFPDESEMTFIADSQQVVSPMDISNVVKTNQGSLATTTEIPALLNYYTNRSGVYSSDSDTVTWNKQVLFENDTLIPKRLMNLLGMFPDKEITVKSYEEGYISAESDTMVVISKVVSDTESFPLEVLKDIITANRQNCYLVNRAELMACLDRIGLFIQEYDEGAVYLTFGNNSIIVTNKRGTSSERIPYVEPINSDNNVVVLVCYNMLLKLLSALSTDVVNIYLDDRENITMKLVGDTVVQAISLLED